MQNKLLKALILFLIGGILYTAMEIFCTGSTHWSMLLLGGICFLFIGQLNESYSWDMAVTSQMLLSGAFITAGEFITGCIVNLWWGLDVWDYSKLPYNLLGQISLKFSCLWVLVSFGAILLDDWLRWKLFGEEKPHYKWL